MTEVLLSLIVFRRSVVIEKKKSQQLPALRCSGMVWGGGFNPQLCLQDRGIREKPVKIFGEILWGKTPYCKLCTILWDYSTTETKMAVVSGYSTRKCTNFNVKVQKFRGTLTGRHYRTPSQRFHSKLPSSPQTVLWTRTNFDIMLTDVHVISRWEYIKYTPKNIYLRARAWWESLAPTSHGRSEGAYPSSEEKCLYAVVHISFCSYSYRVGRKPACLKVCNSCIQDDKNRHSINYILCGIDFAKFVQRIFKCGNIQNASLTLDKELKDLISGTLFCVVVYRS